MKQGPNSKAQQFVRTIKKQVSPTSSYNSPERPLFFIPRRHCHCSSFLSVGSDTQTVHVSPLRSSAEALTSSVSFLKEAMQMRQRMHNASEENGGEREREEEEEEGGEELLGRVCGCETKTSGRTSWKCRLHTCYQSERWGFACCDGRLRERKCIDGGELQPQLWRWLADWLFFFFCINSWRQDLTSGTLERSPAPPNHPLISSHTVFSYTRSTDGAAKLLLMQPHVLRFTLSTQRK